jgi:methylated-DNA-[protein]-cysteine S-methyltransferase
MATSRRQPDGAAYDVFADDIGWGVAVARGGRLVALSHFDDEDDAELWRRRNHPAAVRDPRAVPLPTLRRQLDEYLAGSRTTFGLTFDLPLEPSGTDFQRRVWRALLDIPYGETRSYADLARTVGSPRAMRAVGQANRRNPIGVVVPCHRVIAADGTIGGYAGGLDRKRHLLRLEGVVVD